MKKKKTIFWVTIYVIALVAISVIVYVLPSVAGLFDRSYVAKYGNVEINDDVEGCVVREETVYKLDKPATVKHKIKEDTLVRTAIKVVALSGNDDNKTDDNFTDLYKKMDQDNLIATIDGTTKAAGYVSYRLDGLEYLNHDKLKKLSEKKLGNLKVDEAKLSEGEIRKGAPIFKIVANGNWWFVFFVDNSKVEHYTKNGKVQIEIGNTKKNGFVESIKKGKDSSRIVIKSGEYFKDFTSTRLEKATITAASADGVIIKSRSMVKKDGELGVIVKDKIGRLKFKPVKIKANNGEEAAVFEDQFMDEKNNFVKTITTYDEVVKSPSKRDIANSKNIN